MKNHVFYTIGAILLSSCCFRQQFEKSGWNIAGVFAGFILMGCSYLL